ncbi:PBSX family phage terminase large subunit [Lapidilactobacillus achengensis]|uniref:PBSX family phage terminase large subunit n=1 Tax=Lapidilactobacillus achengensis TaxID=2486000 RepID=A0ABW1UMN0_9LACO|nr:PBSX family phage terminase large subunit [Lapidilactobacillus achengensis]
MKIKRATFQFKPFSDKQLQVLSWWMWPNTAKLDAIICDGSVRAGKTVVMSLSYVMWSMSEFDEQQFGMAGKTIGSLRRNVIRPLKQMLASRKYRVIDHQTDNMLEISKGGKTNYYFLFGGKDEGSQDLVQGLTAAGFFFDEVALMPESFVAQATARVSVEGGKFWFNCNPAGPYHWFKLQWIDKLKEKHALRIHFRMSDNLSLSQSIIDRYERMYTGVFYKRYILGEWVLSEGVIYDNFDEELMVEDLPAGTQFEKYYVSVDYGTLNPTVFLLWGKLGDTWYCIKEFYYSGRESSRQWTDEQYVDAMDKFVGTLKPTLIVDPSAASFITLLRSRGYKVMKANNDVLDGIRATQSAMNTGKIKFSSTLKHLFAEFSSYIWDAKAEERGEDKPVKEHDHTMDAMRYFVYMVIYRNPVAKIKKRPSWLH